MLLGSSLKSRLWVGCIHEPCLRQVSAARNLFCMKCNLFLLFCMKYKVRCVSSLYSHLDCNLPVTGELLPVGLRQLLSTRPPETSFTVPGGQGQNVSWANLETKYFKVEVREGIRRDPKQAPGVCNKRWGYVWQQFERTRCALTAQAAPHADEDAERRFLILLLRRITNLTFFFFTFFYLFSFCNLSGLSCLL